MDRVYRDFMLVLSDVEMDAALRSSAFDVHVFDSPVGQGEKTERVVVPETLHTQLDLLEDRKLDDDLDAQIELGQILGSLLFPTYARGLLQRSMDRLAADEGLRIRIRLQDADVLAALPWEFVHLHEHRAEAGSPGFLALDRRISIVRHEVVATPGDWEHGPAKRRLVVAMASPWPQKQLKALVAEQAAIREAVAEVDGVSVDFFPVYANEKDLQRGATIKDLLAIIESNEPIDIFHFSGHGTFGSEENSADDAKGGSGGLIFADDKNRSVLLPAGQLAELLQGQGVRLVVLGACESAKRDQSNVWSSVAAALMQVGVPAVIAMQYRVNDSATKGFMGTLYRSLTAGHTIDTAVSLGRQAMRLAAVELDEKRQNRRDWGVPTLYMRAADGRIFTPIDDEVAAIAAEADLEQLGVEVDLKLGDVSGTALGAVVGNLEEGSIDVKMDARNIHQNGLVIGGAVYSMSGGKLSVNQEIETVSGVLIGATINTIGGSSHDPEQDALKKLYADLGITVLTDRNVQNEEDKPKYCHNCGKPVSPSAKFCGHCGNRL